jgi:hypothetical protein
MLHVWNSGSSIVQFSNMIMHLLIHTLSVHEFLAKNTLPTHQIVCHLTSLPKFEMALNGRKFNYITTIQAKLQNTLVGFQTAHFSQCSEQWHHCWAHCIKSQGNYSECDNTDWKVKWCCYEEINSVQRSVTPHTKRTTSTHWTEGQVGMLAIQLVTCNHTECPQILQQQNMVLQNNALWNAWQVKTNSVLTCTDIPCIWLTGKPIQKHW